MDSEKPVPVAVGQDKQVDTGKRKNLKEKQKLKKAAARAAAIEARGGAPPERPVREKVALPTGGEPRSKKAEKKAAAKARAANKQPSIAKRSRDTDEFNLEEADDKPPQKEHNKMKAVVAEVQPKQQAKPQPQQKQQQQKSPQQEGEKPKKEKWKKPKKPKIPLVAAAKPSTPAPAPKSKSPLVVAAKTPQSAPTTSAPVPKAPQSSVQNAKAPPVAAAAGKKQPQQPTQQLTNKHNRVEAGEAKKAQVPTTTVEKKQPQQSASKKGDEAAEKKVPAPTTAVKKQEQPIPKQSDPIVKTTDDGDATPAPAAATAAKKAPVQEQAKKEEKKEGDAVPAEQVDSKKEKDEADAEPKTGFEKYKEEAKKRPSVFGLPEYEFDTDYNDHFETDLTACQDMLPTLEELRSLVRPNCPEAFSLYDPYYCDGKIAATWRQLGIERVFHENRDFYLDIKRKEVPTKYDILVTNPPFSADHIPRLFNFLCETKKPFAVLIPDYVATKDWYQTLIKSKFDTVNSGGVVREEAQDSLQAFTGFGGGAGGASDSQQFLSTNMTSRAEEKLGMEPFYLVPKLWYQFKHPEASGKAGGSHFKCMWYVWLGRRTVEVVSALQCKMPAREDLHGQEPPLAVVHGLDGLARGRHIRVDQRKNPKQRAALQAKPKAGTASSGGGFLGARGFGGDRGRGFSGAGRDGQGFVPRGGGDRGGRGGGRGLGRGSSAPRGRGGRGGNFGGRGGSFSGRGGGRGRG